MAKKFPQTIYVTRENEVTGPDARTNDVMPSEISYTLLGGDVRVSLFARAAATISADDYDVACRMLDLAKLALRKHVGNYTRIQTVTAVPLNAEPPLTDAFRFASGRSSAGEAPDDPSLG